MRPFSRAPSPEDANAHIEQKTRTHIHNLPGYVGYDTLAALDAINGLPRHQLRLFQSLFRPSIKLVRKERGGARRPQPQGRPRVTSEMAR